LVSATLVAVQVVVRAAEVDPDILTVHDGTGEVLSKR
jgi:hypothetical protein